MKAFLKYLGIILLIVGAYFFLRKIFSSISSAPTEFKESEESVKRKYSKYLLLLRTNEKLDKELNHSFITIYSIARIFIFIISFIPLALLFLFKDNVSLNSVELYIAFAPHIVWWLYYIVLSKDFSFREFNESVKLRVKTWVYRNNINLEENIEYLKEEVGSNRNLLKNRVSDQNP